MEDDHFVFDSSSSSTTPVTATGAFHGQQHFRRRVLASDTVPSALLAQGATRRIPIHVGRAVLLPQLAPTRPVAAVEARAGGAKAFRTIQREALGRHDIYRAASNQLGMPIPRQQARAKTAPATERVRGTPLRNAVESWKSSGFKIINSRSTINDSVDVGARANPYGIYPVVFPFHGHPLSSSNKPRQNTEMPRYSRVPRGQYHQVPQGCVASRMALDYYSAEIMRRAGCFGLAKHFIPISTAKYGGRAHSSSSSRARKCGETRKPSAEVGKSKPDRQAALRIAELAASSTRLSARVKAERSVGMTFNSGLLAEKGSTKDERGHNVRSSMIGNSKANSSSGCIAALLSGTKVAEMLIPPAVQWRRGLIAFPQEIGVGSAGIGPQEVREIDAMGHMTPMRKVTNPVPSISEDDADSWLTDIPLKTQQQAGELLAVTPLSTLRSDDRVETDGDDRMETDGDESVMFFPQDLLPLCDVKDRDKTEITDAGDGIRERNDPLPNAVDIPPLSSIAEPQIFQLGDVELRGFDFQPRGNQESGSLGHEEHWLDVEVHEPIRGKNSSSISKMYSSQFATDNVDTSRTGLFGAEESLVPEVKAPSVENHAGGILGELPSSGILNTSERSKVPNDAWPSQVTASSGPPGTVKSVPPPSSVKGTRTIQQQSSLASLPSWAHQPPVLELDTVYLPSSLAFPGPRVSHGEDNPERLDLGEVSWQGSAFPNKRKHRAKPGCTSTLMTLEPPLGMRPTSWTSMEGECVIPAVEEAEISGVRADVGVGSRNTEQCFVHRWQGLGQPETATCSSPGCQRRWAWESMLSEKAMEHSTHCCPPHKCDG